MSAAASGRRRPSAARALLAGNQINGPALIEEHASTTVLMPGDTCEVDAYGNLVIAVGARVNPAVVMAALVERSDPRRLASARQTGWRFAH